MKSNVVSILSLSLLSSLSHAQSQYTSVDVSPGDHGFGNYDVMEKAQNSYGPHAALKPSGTLQKIENVLRALESTPEATQLYSQNPKTFLRAYGFDTTDFELLKRAGDAGEKESGCKPDTFCDSTSVMSWQKLEKQHLEEIGTQLYSYDVRIQSWR